MDYHKIGVNLGRIFSEWSHEPVLNINKLPVSGSERTYFRLSGETKTAIGAYHENARENRAYLGLTRHFLSHGLHVPAIYGEDLPNHVYLVQDLSDNTLFKLVENNGGRFDDVLVALYKKVTEDLVRFQVVAGNDLDYSLCYPRPEFDRQSIVWDLNYFKFYFLKPQVSFDEQRLEDDFRKFADYLLETPGNYFMYRDFQSRNIMLLGKRPYYIDFQGGRRGPVQYDIASLLFQVRAGIPFKVRDKLLDHYISALSRFVSFSGSNFRKYYSGFVLVRLLQVMGAYGFRGLFEKKTHFVDSIPYAIDNLKWWLSEMDMPIDLPELMRSLEKLATRYRLPDKEPRIRKLTVTIRSFSYKDGIPADDHGNGGGFVFDCRALPNPGREEKYRSFTGKDSEVVNYLSNEQEVKNYLNYVSGIVDQAVENYMHRGFGYLSIGFGCTGGQHRSVYCAEMIAAHLINKYPIKVIIEHNALPEKIDL